MTTRWVALLRGIAPMHPQQKNDTLRGVCEALGYRRVTSVQSSGNLIFDAESSVASEIVAALEQAWREQLGFESRTILRTPEELQALVDLQPYGAQQHGRESYQLVTFFPDPVDVGVVLPHQIEGRAAELVHATEREIFSVTDTTAAGKTPDTMAWLQRRYGRDLTSRTFPTLSRILKRC